MKILINENQVLRLFLQGDKKIKKWIFKLWDSMDSPEQENFFSKAVEMVGISPSNVNETIKVGHMLSMYFLEWRGGINENGDMDFSKLDEEIFKEKSITVDKHKVYYKPFDYEIENGNTPYDIVVELKIWGSGFEEYYNDFGLDSNLVSDIISEIREELVKRIYYNTGFFVMSVKEYVD